MIITFNNYGACFYRIYYLNINKVGTKLAIKLGQ